MKIEKGKREKNAKLKTFKEERERSQRLRHQGSWREAGPLGVTEGNNS